MGGCVGGGSAARLTPPAGLLHEYGLGCPQDFVAAARWYLDAHEMVGHGADMRPRVRRGAVAADSVACLTRMRRATILRAQGDYEASYNLGLMYAYGRGVALDYTRAALLFQSVCV